MNLPLLYWASSFSGDASFRLVADAHAAFTRRGFVRADDSTFHAVEYDEGTGHRVRGYTFQGYADDSAWSRGQTWAIYGYAQSARETRKIEYLQLADRLAAYYFRALRRSRAWDFDAPNPRQSEGFRRCCHHRLSGVRLGQPVSGRTSRPVIGASAPDRTVSCTDYLAREDPPRVAEARVLFETTQRRRRQRTMFGDFFFTRFSQLPHAGRLAPEIPNLLNIEIRPQPRPI
jgi:unsaturated chondroitin disaccharide hydrolase